MEYYSSFNDHRYLHYQSRMKGLLSNPTVAEVLDQSKLISRSSQKRASRRSFSGVKDFQQASNEVEDVVEKHTTWSNSSSSKAKQDIKNQESLDGRLRARRRSSSLKSTRIPNKKPQPKRSMLPVFDVGNRTDEIKEALKKKDSMFGWLKLDS